MITISIIVDINWSTDKLIIGKFTMLSLSMIKPSGWLTVGLAISKLAYGDTKLILVSLSKMLSMACKLIVIKLTYLKFVSLKQENSFSMHGSESEGTLKVNKVFA